MTTPDLQAMCLAKVDELRKKFYLTGWLNKEGDKQMDSLLRALHLAIEMLSNHYPSLIAIGKELGIEPEPEKISTKAERIERVKDICIKMSHDFEIAQLCEPCKVKIASIELEALHD